MCAAVPVTGMPKRRPASTLDVPAKPTAYAARAASTAAAGWVRRVPNSTTTALPAASTTRAALEAIIVAWLIAESRNVSTSCASTMGAWTRRKGSLANAAVPSGLAATSPVKRSARR